jgi:putative Holliday junction resolvase
MRSLAIDFGTRRIGLALSDAGGTLASPYVVLKVGSPQRAMNLIGPIIVREGVERLVVGLPLNMDGTVGPAARATVAWATELSRQCATPVVFVDERLSSFDAEQNLTARKRAGEKLTRSRKKQQLDALAAAGFLQAFLDGRLSAVSTA